MKNAEYYNVNLPDDVSLTNTDNGWKWEFRCLSSEDDYDLFFSDVDDALCHLILVLTLEQDKTDISEEE